MDKLSIGAKLLINKERIRQKNPKTNIYTKKKTEILRDRKIERKSYFLYKRITVKVAPRTKTNTLCCKFEILS